MKKTILFLIGVIFILSSCGENNANKNTPTTPAPSVQKTEKSNAKQGQAYVKDESSEANALQIASSIPDFSTLVAAISAAGVENAVVNAGPLTIFAPLNSAFDKLPDGTVASLLEPENKGKLAYILTNHVAPSNYHIKQLKKEAKKGRKLYMASGKYLGVEHKEDGLYVGGSKIIKTVKASNGWIHVIDDVLVPEN